MSWMRDPVITGLVCWLVGGALGYTVGYAAMERAMWRQMRDIKAAQVAAIAAGETCAALSKEIGKGQ